MTSPFENPSHMNDLQIAAYLDRGLRPNAREDMESHLASCALCREKVAGSQASLDFARKRRLVSRFAIVGTIAAVITLMVISPVAKRETTAIERDVDKTKPLPVYSPIGTVNSVPAKFVWAAVRGATTYTITVSSPDGTTLWTASVSDTVAPVPPRLVERHGTYVWVVDATLSDQSVRASGLTQFEVK
jgi:hypothetical protein